MGMKRLPYRFLVLGVLLLLPAGCERIHEPWVRSREQLAEERARPDAAQVELRNRLLAVQTDR